MLKTAFIFLFGLLCFQTVKAQKADTLSSYMTYQDEIVDTKDSADYLLQVMMPADSSKGVKIYHIKQFYMNGKLKLIGAAMVIANGRQIRYVFDGPKIEYYFNGHKRMMASYQANIPAGNIYNYYPDGHLHSVVKYDGLIKYVECRDSTGKILAQNGSGKWIKFDIDYKHKAQEGMIKDSLEDGEWVSYSNDSSKYTSTYKKGRVISSTQPGWNEKQLLASKEKRPEFKGGDEAFDNYISHTVRLPPVPRQNGVRSKVVVSFTVKADGSLTNIKALQGPSRDVMDAVVRAVEQSPKWDPAIRNGSPISSQYIMTFFL